MVNDPIVYKGEGKMKKKYGTSNSSSSVDSVTEIDMCHPSLGDVKCNSSSQTGSREGKGRKCISSQTGSDHI